MKAFAGLALLLFFSAAGRAQVPVSVSSQLGSARSTIQVRAQISSEGSYQFQRSSVPFTNWTVLTNFNFLRGAAAWEEPITLSNRIFRAVQLTVPAAITAQPAGITNYSGQQVRLEGAAAGSWPLRLQWYKDAQPIPGATSNVYSFTGTTALSGSYVLFASNTWGMEFSAPAVVRVNRAALTTAGGHKIHFVIQNGTGNFLNSGSFDTVFDPSGFHTTQSTTSVYLNDSGYWQYASNETIGQIYYPYSITYPDALFTLTFQTATNGTYTLAVPTFSGGQTGTFSVVY